jgi:hypothetical protein
MDIRVPDDTKASGYHFENKVTINGLIHDECLMSVDNDVNHEFMMKLIQENCIMDIKGHPKYYAGVNIIHNWYQAKNDNYECPAALLDDIGQSNPPKFALDSSADVFVLMLAKIKKYLDKRIEQEINLVEPTVMQTGYVDCIEFMSKFKNYFVKPKLIGFFPGKRKFDEDEKRWDDEVLAALETYLAIKFDRVIIKLPGDNLRVLERVADSLEIHEVMQEDNEWKDLIQTEAFEYGAGDNSNNTESADDEAYEELDDEALERFTSVFAEIDSNYKDTSVLSFK